MEHPVAGVVGDELDIPRLRHSYKHCVSRSPCRLGLAASFSPCNYELVPMKVDRMVIHSQIASDQFTADPKSLSDCGNTCHTAVKAKDYIFHPYEKR